MSLSYTQLEPVKVVDPTSLEEKGKYLFKTGHNQYTYQTFQSNSFTSTAASFKLTPPSSNVLVSRYVLLTAKFKVELITSARSFAGLLKSISQIADLLPGFQPTEYAHLGSDLVPVSSADTGRVYYNSKSALCLRAFPLNSVIANTKLSVNGDVLSQNTNLFIHPLSRFNQAQSDRDATIFPSQLDPYQKYQDSGSESLYTITNNNIANIARVATKGLGLGGIRNPFSLYGESSGDVTRASYTELSDIDIVYIDQAGAPVNRANISADAVASRATFNITISEPILLPLLSSGSQTLMALSQITNMDLYLNFQNDLTRLFSVDMGRISTNGEAAVDGNAPNISPAVQYARGIKKNSRIIDSFSVSVISNGDASIKMAFYTPQVNIPIPKSLVYDFNDYETFQQNIGTEITSGSSVKVQSNNIVLSSIPKTILIYAQKDPLKKTYSDTDTYLNISNVSIQFNNVSGILSSASEEDLFLISQNSCGGFRDSFMSWKYYAGSVLAIDTEKLGLPPNMAVGMLGNYSLSYNVTLKNISSLAFAAGDITLQTLIINTGVYTITNGGQIIKQIGVVTPEDVVGSASLDLEQVREYNEMAGDGLISAGKNIYNKVRAAKPYVQKANQVAKYLNPAVSVISPRAGEIVEDVTKLVDKLVGHGYTKKQAKEMLRKHSKAEIKQLLKQHKMGMGGNMVAGNMVAGKMMSKNKLKSRMIKN